MLKKALIGIGLLAAVVVLLGVAIMLPMQLAAPSRDGLRAGPVETVVDGFVSAFLIDIAPGQIALVDAGADRDAKAIKAALVRRGLDASAVKAILLTHGHGDHTGGEAQFPGAVVWAHADEVPLIRGTAPARSPMAHLRSAAPSGRVDETFVDGQVIALGDLDIRAYHVPGHTAGSAAFLVAGQLLLGDSAIATRDGELDPAPWFFTDDRAQNRQSLAALARRLEGQHVEQVHLAHSGPVGVQALGHLAYH